jgi:hypothetical protein
LSMARASARMTAWTVFDGGFITRCRIVSDKSRQTP